MGKSRSDSLGVASAAASPPSEFMVIQTVLKSCFMHGGEWRVVERLRCDADKRLRPGDGDGRALIRSQHSDIRAMKEGISVVAAVDDERQRRWQQRGRGEGAAERGGLGCWRAHKRRMAKLGWGWDGGWWNGRLELRCRRTRMAGIMARDWLQVEEARGKESERRRGCSTKSTETPVRWVHLAVSCWYCSGASNWLGASGASNDYRR